MNVWKTKFLNKVADIKKMQGKITRVIFSEDANNHFIGAPDLDITDHDGYSTAIRLGNVEVPIHINMGFRTPVIVIEYDDKSNMPQSVAVHMSA